MILSRGNAESSQLMTLSLSLSSSFSFPSYLSKNPQRYGGLEQNVKGREGGKGRVSPTKELKYIYASPMPQTTGWGRTRGGVGTGRRGLKVGNWRTSVILTTIK